MKLLTHHIRDNLISNTHLIDQYIEDELYFHLMEILTYENTEQDYMLKMHKSVNNYK